MGKRNIRRNVVLTKEMDKDLKRLSKACDMSVSTLVYKILQQLLYDDKFVVELQDEYGKNEVLRAFLMRENGKPRFL